MLGSPTMRARYARMLAVCSLGLPLVLAGCGGGAYGGDLAMRPKPSPVKGAMFSLPADAKYSITLAPSQKSPGLAGTAEANSSATDDGEANAFAKVDNGGTAFARFQLGHALQNDSDRQADFEFVVKCDYEYSAKAEPASEAAKASVSLNLFALDGRNHQLCKLGMVGHSTADGDAAGGDAKTMRFSVTVGPHDEVDVYVAGSVDIMTEPGEHAEGSLKLGGLTMEVSSRAAPAVRQAGDEKE